MVCNHCGAPLEPGMRVCPRCGYSIDSDGTSPERTAIHRPHEGRTNTRNRDAFMAATSAGQPSVDRATPVRADGHPCLYCGTIIPDDAISCPKCGRSVSGKAPSVSGAMPPVPKTPRQAYEARTGQSQTRASVAATAAYAAMAQKMGYDTSPRQITGEIPPVAAQTSGKIPPVSQGSEKIPPVEAQTSGKIPPVAAQSSGKIPAVSQGSGKFPPVSQSSGKIPPVTSQDSGEIPPISAQSSGKFPPVERQNSGKIPAVVPSAAATAPLGEPIKHNPETENNTNSGAENNQADITAVLPPLSEEAVAGFSATADEEASSQKNPYAGAHAKPTAGAASGAAKKHPTKAKAPLSTTRQNAIGVAPISSRDLTNEEKRSKRHTVVGVGIITCVLAAGVGIGAWWFNGGDENQRLVDYIETLGSFNKQDNNSDDENSPFDPTNHTNTGGTGTKQLDEDSKDKDTKEEKKDSKTKSSSTDKAKSKEDKDKLDKEDESKNKNSSTKKPTITNTTDSKNPTSNNNHSQGSSSSSSKNNGGGSTNTWSTPSNSNNNYGGSNNNTGSNSGSSSTIWPDDLNNPPYQYYPPNPGTSGSTGSWGSGNSGNTGSWGGGGGSSWGGTSGSTGTYYPPIGELESEADKELKKALEEAKARVEDYILPESDKRDYLRKELEQLTDFELYLARNEIYARHGRIFNVAALDEYFNTRKWYDGKYTGVVFDAMENMLNEFEIRNAELLKEIERERNSPYLSE